MAWAQPQITYKINTFAGLRVVEDGIPAIQAQLHFPEAVAVDGSGNLYIADTHNNSSRKIDATGTITTVAGTGEYGFGGDGGPASWAFLNNPAAVTVDSAGNLYIADTGNERIRILTPSTVRTRLDFAHFANGDGITSDLVFVNVATHPIQPALYFYDKEGNLIAAESVVDLTGDLEITEDGALPQSRAGADPGNTRPLKVKAHDRGDRSVR